MTISVTKDLLIDALKKQGIGLIERYNEKAPPNRKWSLEFFELDGEQNDEYAIFFTDYKSRKLIPVDQFKIFSNSSDSLYGSRLISALEYCLNSITTLKEISSDLSKKHLEFHEAKLFNIQFNEKTKSLSQALLMDAIENG